MSEPGGSIPGPETPSAPAGAEGDGAGQKGARSLIWKWISIVGGVMLLLIGIAGLALPGIQGVLTILAALALLSPHSRRARWLLRWIKDRFHRVRGLAGHAEDEDP